MSDLPIVISDEKQRDPKSKSFARDMGIDRHERQYFPMGQRLPDFGTDEEVVERLVNDIKNRAVHSFKTSTVRGHTVKVTVSHCTVEEVAPSAYFSIREGFIPGLGPSSKVFEWVVREKGVTLHTGFALNFADGKTILWDTSSPIGEQD